MIYFNSYQNNYGIVIGYKDISLVLVNRDLYNLFKEETKKEIALSCKCMNFTNDLICQNTDELLEVCDIYIEKVRILLARILFFCSGYKERFQSYKNMEEFISSIEYNLPAEVFKFIEKDVIKFKDRYIIDFISFDTKMLDNIYPTKIVMTLFGFASLI